MTLHEIFDAAIAQLEAQPNKAFNPEFGVGAYRYGGAACLFGGMIDDAQFDPAMDAHLDEAGQTVTRLPVHSKPVLDAIERSTGINLLERLSLNDIETIHGLHDVKWEPGQSFKALLPDAVAAKIWGPTRLQ